MQRHPSRRSPAMRAFARALACVGLCLACLPAPVAAAEDDEALHARVMRILASAPLVDGHNDLLIHYHACGAACPRPVEGYGLAEGAPGHTDIARWRQGGVGVQLLNAEFTDGDAPTLEGTLAGVEFVQALAERYPGDLMLARSGADVDAARAQGRIALLPTLENPGRLGTDATTVRRLARAGVRAAVLAYDGPSALADGHAGPAQHGGLSPLGAEMVGWMEQAGMLVDLSHASADTARDLLDIATSPVIFTHSNAAALADLPRNVPDDVLRRLPGNGGLVMVAFVPYFATREFAAWMAEGDAYWESQLAASSGDRKAAQQSMQAWEREHPAPHVGIAEIADHVEHIRKVAGIDHVGIGSDFDGVSFTVAGLEDVSAYPRLFEALARRGWSDADLAKLAGGNALRVLGAVARAVPDGSDAD